MEFNCTHIVIGEIQNVVAAMRLNSRWSAGSPSAHMLVGNSENPLLKAFKTLRNTLDSVSDFKELDALLYLTPFLNIIHSEEANGPITGVALSSVHKFLSYGFITDRTPNVNKAMIKIAETVTHCRFEATDPDSDEVVLMRILRVLLACLKSPAGYLLTDDLVYETVQTCYRMSVQLRLSELLRRTAEHTLIEMLQTIFMTMPVGKCAIEALTGDSPSLVATLPSSTQTVVNPRGIQFQKNADIDAGATTKPYGLPCLIRLFRFACSLISPSSTPSTSDNSLGIVGGNTETMRHLGLRLVNTILETRGSAFVDHSSLLAIVKDDLCKYLLQNLTTDNLPILALTLRVFFNLFTTSLKFELKFQMEVFFNNILICIMENKSATFEKQEIALECLVEFCREPAFMLDLYLNYDCFLHCTNLFENLSKFLYKNAFPVSGSLYVTNILSLDGLLSVVQSITERCKNPPSQEMETTPRENANRLKDVLDADSIRKAKQRKSQLAQAAEAFNRSPDEAFEMLQACGYWPRPTPSESSAAPESKTAVASSYDPNLVAQFLRFTPGLNKKEVGEFIGKNKPFNISVLVGYVNTFDFKGMRLSESVRQFLQSMRLPLEAQMISRILEAFAQRYFDHNPTIYPDVDSVFLLTFSIVMLHSDHHNPNVKNKMTLDQYIRNCTGIPGLKDFSREVLEAIFADVTSTEIKIPDEFPGGEITDTRWREFFASRPQLVGAFSSSGLSSALFDKEIFSIIKAPVIAAISVVFDTAYEDGIIQKALDGFGLCAQISAYYNMSDVFDSLVIALCKFSTLVAVPSSGTSSSPYNPIANFAKNKKAQLALITAFSITHKYGDHLREGWRNIVGCITTLHKLDLLPSITQLSTFSSPSARRNPQPRTEKTSILSAITVGWFGSSNTSDSNAITKEESIVEMDPEAEKQTTECIKQCHIKQLITDSKYLQADSLISFVKALIIASSSRGNSAAPSVSPSAPTLLQSSSSQSPLLQTLRKPTTTSSTPNLVPVDDNIAILCLELLTAITLNNEDRIIYLWMLIYEHFASIITSGASSTVVVEKAIMMIMVLCSNLMRRSELSEQIGKFFQLISKLPSVVIESASETIAVGLSKLLLHPITASATETTNSNPETTNATHWPMLFSLLENLAEHHSSAGIAFNTLCTFLGSTSQLTKENYLPCLNAILAFTASKHCNSQTAIKAMELMNMLYTSASNFIQTGASSGFTNEAEIWTGYWLPVLQGFCCLCRDGRPDVRNYAMTYLQRVLLSSDIQQLSPEAWRNCFEQVLFPLLTELLKPFSENTAINDTMGVEETRLRASVLLSKIFLQYLPKLTLLPDFHKLWLQILHFIEIYMKADRSDLLAEAIPEALKNILLVMTATGVLQPGAKTASGEDIWKLSWSAIDAFCPSLKDEILPKQASDVRATATNRNTEAISSPTSLEVDTPNKTAISAEIEREFVVVETGTTVTFV